MPDRLIDVLLGAGLSLLVLWLLLVAVLLVARPGAGTLAQALRLLPDVLRLLPRLARDPAVPWRTRALLWVTVAYLAFPVDLVPDVIPVLGYADDVIVVTVVLRAVVRRAGLGTVERLWPGTPDGLEALSRLVGLAPSGPRADRAGDAAAGA